MSKKVAINLWGRDFLLKVTYDCFDGEEILEEQVSAVKDFQNADTSKSLDLVKSYCLEMNRSDIGNTIENIFKYVIPRSLYVPRQQKKSTLVLLCDYKFDLEHGIAVVFEDKKATNVCNPDIFL